MPQIDTDQAAREASGSHPYGRYLEEFEVGAVYKHWPAKTVTESDDHLFCLITMNHHPLHLNDSPSRGATWWSGRWCTRWRWA
jgi:acyl dehydratase